MLACSGRPSLMPAAIPRPSLSATNSSSSVSIFMPMTCPSSFAFTPV